MGTGLACGTKGQEDLVGVLVWEVIKADRHTDVARKADVNAEVDQPLSLGPWGEGNFMNPKGPLQYCPVGAIGLFTHPTYPNLPSAHWAQ